MMVPASATPHEPLTRLAEALLTPLQGPDATAWHAQVDEALRAGFGCDHVMFVTPEDGRVAFRSPTIDPAVLRHFEALTTRDPRTGLFTAQDPVVETWFQARRADRLEVFTEEVNTALLARFGHAIDESEIAQTVWRGGMLDFFGLMTECDGSEMMLITGFERRGRARLEGEAIRRALTLVLPAFRAGHHALVRLAERRAAIGATLDFLHDALLLADGAGRERHRNAALRTLLADDPEGERIAAVARQAALEVATVGRARLVRAGGDAPPPQATREVRTARGRYVVRAVPAAEAMFDLPDAVLVSVARAVPAMLDDATLRTRFGLTTREIEVARHLARGLGNAELAEALGVSPYTARNHTERVLAKLGVSSRARVGAVLRDEPPLPPGTLPA